jgi:WD40 repeat protein
VVFSSDGQSLFSAGSSPPRIKKWNALATAKKSYFREPAFPVGFEPGGALVAFGSELRPLDLNPETFQVKEQSDSVLAKGRNVLTRVGVFLLPKDAELSELQWRDTYLGNLSSDGRFAALRLMPQKMEIWDLEERKRLCTVPSERPWVAFAPRRGLFATDTSNATTTVWHLATGELKWVFTNRVSPFQAIAFSPNENFIVTDEVTHLKLWLIEGENVKAAATFHPKQSVLTGFAYSPDGKLLATGEEDGSIRLWSMPSTKPAGVLSGHTHSVFSFAFSPDGRTLASMCDDQTTRLWHLVTHRELLRFQAPKEDQSFFSLRFSPDGRALAARRVDDEGAITFVWHAPSSEEIEHSGHE